jgi:flagellar hook-associated protein 2
MASITSVGVGSGIDLENLIKNIINAERAPVEKRLDLQQTLTKAEISAMGSLRLTMGAFKGTLSDLKDSNFFSTRSATSGNSQLFTATAGTNADLANYNIQVFEQAQANKIASNTDFSDPSATVGSGTLTVGLEGGLSFDITVAATDTIAEIRDAINAAPNNVGITASLITVDAGQGDGSTISKFVFTSNNSGASGQINISVDDDDLGDTDGSGLSQFFYDGSLPLDAGNQFSQVDAAQDARISVDGFTVYSSSNTFDDVIDDVSITILQGAKDILDPPSGALNISVDTAKVTAAVELFVASYNELIIVFNRLTNYDPVSDTSGLLGSDAGVNALEQGIRGVLGNVVEGAATDLSILAFIGISTNSNGTISLDSDKLADTVSNRLDDLGTLFSSEEGVATQMDSLLKEYLQSGGVFDNRNTRLEGTLNSIQDQRDDLNLRLNVIEKRFRSQFAALDLLVSQLNSTGNFLSQQLEAAAQIINRDS